MTADPLARLAADEGAQAALAAARDAIDAVLWRRDVRAAAAQVAADSVVRGAQASASIDGADIFQPDDSPMGRTLACAVAATAAVPGLVDTWERAPLQALASLHAHAAAGFVDADLLGRPRRDDHADDPLHLGPLPAADEVGARLQLLADLVTAPTAAPALVVAAIVHAELTWLRPFAHGSGLVARAATRCVLAGRGVDPALFTIPEHGMADAGRPALVRAMRSYAEGTPAGMAAYLTWFADACRDGAAAVRLS